MGNPIMINESGAGRNPFVGAATVRERSCTRPLPRGRGSDALNFLLASAPGCGMIGGVVLSARPLSQGEGPCARPVSSCRPWPPRCCSPAPAAPPTSPTASSKGTPDLKSAGPLAFGPEGILFVGDPQGAAVFALDTGDRTPAKSDATGPRSKTSTTRSPRWSASTPSSSSSTTWPSTRSPATSTCRRRAARGRTPPRCCSAWTAPAKSSRSISKT